MTPLRETPIVIHCVSVLPHLRTNRLGVSIGVQNNTEYHFTNISYFNFLRTYDRSPTNGNFHR